MYFQNPKYFWEMTPQERAEALLSRQQEEDERQKEWERRRQAYLQEQAERERILHQEEMRFHKNHKLFLETEGLYLYDPDGCISSQELYEIYKNWCIQEELPIKPPREFWLYLKENAPAYRLTYSGNIIDSKGKRSRGFRGIRALNLRTDITDHTDTV